MAENGKEELRSGDPLITFDGGLEVLSWNRAAEELTGVPAHDAVGHRCWEIVAGRDGTGATVCHAGCSYGRLAREGWPVPGHDLTIRTESGRRRVAVSTIAIRGGKRPVFAHILLVGAEAQEQEPAPPVSTKERPPELTPRQREILQRLGEGQPAKLIARDLGLAETTVRNHIRAVLLELSCHSQLAAVAKSRRLGIL